MRHYTFISMALLFVFLSPRIVIADPITSINFDKLQNSGHTKLKYLYQTNVILLIFKLTVRKS